MNSYQKKSIKLKPHQFRKLTMEVFERDGFRCQMDFCKRTDYGLYPHHIILKARLRLDVDWNLITVCPTCHNEIHNVPGLVDQIIKDHNLENYNTINEQS